MITKESLTETPLGDSDLLARLFHDIFMNEHDQDRSRSYEGGDITYILIDFINLLLNNSLGKHQRQQLLFFFKRYIDRERHCIRSLASEYSKDSSEEVIHEYQKTLAHRVEKFSLELLKTIDDKLLPAIDEKDAEAFVYYTKFKADIYRYMCESNVLENTTEYLDKAEKYYKAATDRATADLPSHSHESLGVFLNYSVFLYEICDKKEEALELSRKIHEENMPKVDESEDDEAKKIMISFQSNIETWLK